MAVLRGPLSRLRWRTRTTLWLAALFSGLIVVAFAKLADMSLRLFESLAHGRAWVPLLLAPTIGMLTVWLTRRYFPGAQGSGIPQVIAATKLASQRKAVNSLVSLRLAVGKVFLGALALLGHAYLIPFENRRKGITEVQFIVGYRGMLDLARRSGQIMSIEARFRLDHISQ